MWLNGDGTDLQKLGIIATKEQLHNNRPHTQRIQYSKPNSLGDSWTFSLQLVGEPRLRKSSLTGRKQQMIILKLINVPVTYLKLLHL